MTPLRQRILSLAGLAVLCLPLVAAGPQKLNVEIFVVSSDKFNPIEGAVVTVTPDVGGVQTAEMEGPNPHARFSLPGATSSIAVDVEVRPCGIAAPTVTIQINRPRVGGNGIWIYVPPCIEATSTVSR
jgi:hypothetical protein